MARELTDLRGLEWTERRWSFVASDHARGEFLKLPKGRPDTPFDEALEGVDERRLATNEHDTLAALARFSRPGVAVTEPLALLDVAPVVITRLVPSLVPLARRLGGEPSAWRAPLQELGAWLADVHAAVPDQMVDGLKLDNLALDDAGRLWFFDPNEFLPGSAEDDLARLCVTLLARDYERPRPPRAGSIEPAMAFLVGYGIERIDQQRFATAFARWAERLDREMRHAGSQRLQGPLRAGLAGWLALHRRLLALQGGRLRERLARDAGTGEELGERYSSDEVVAVYRQQQEGIAVRSPRLGALAQREIATVMRALGRLGVRGPVLDVPHGTGKLGPHLTGLTDEVVGGDASATMLAQATPQPGLTRAVLDIRRLPFRDGAFDGAVSLRLFHRLQPQARREGLRELARVSRRWVVVSYARFDGPYRLRYHAISRVRGERDWAPHPATKDEILAEADQAGLVPRALTSVAGLLSNEVVLIAELAAPRAGDGSWQPFACIACGGSLAERPGQLECADCGAAYRLQDGVPDLSEGLTASTNTPATNRSSTGNAR
jgi:uncharacterized protein YbaR (Trm112 family)